MIEKTIKLNVENKDAIESINEVDQSVDKVNESTQDLTSSFDKMTGGLVSGFKNAVGGIRKGVVAMKSLKVAIAATGVGLLVIAIDSLVTFFTKTESGAKKLEVVMAQLGAAIDVIIDRVSAFGEAIFKFFSGDTEGAINGIKDSFAGLGDELEREIQLAKDLTIATQELLDIEIDQIVVQAERRKLIEINRFAAKDRQKSIEERISALKLAQALENAILEDEKANQEERVRIAQLDTDRANSSVEDRRLLEEEKAKLIDLTTESLRRQRTVESELQSLLQESARGVEVNLREKVNPVTGLTTSDLDQIITDQNELIKQRGDELGEAIKEQTLERLRNANAETDARVQLQDDIVSASENTLGALTSIAGQETDLGKALLITKQVAAASEIAIGISKLQFKASETVAEAAMDGAKATTSVATGAAVTLSAGFPAAIPLLIGYAAAAVGIVSSIVQATKTSKSVAAQYGGTGPAIATPEAPPPPSFNIVGTAPENQLANTISESTQQPIQAFVVANEVSTQQALDRNKVDTASFG